VSAPQRTLATLVSGIIDDSGTRLTWNPREYYRARAWDDAEVGAVVQACYRTLLVIVIGAAACASLAIGFVIIVATVWGRSMGPTSTQVVFVCFTVFGGSAIIGVLRAGWSIAGRTARRRLLLLGVCPRCAGWLEPEPTDGLTPCPECGAKWRLVEVNLK
jgi:hypothetical protein